MKIRATIDTSLTGELNGFNKSVLNSFARRVFCYDALQVPSRIDVRLASLRDTIPPLFQGLKIIELVPEPLGYQTPIYLVMEKGYVKDVYARTSAEGDVFLKKTPMYKGRLESLGQIYVEKEQCPSM